MKEVQNRLTIMTPMHVQPGLHDTLLGSIRDIESVENEIKYESDENHDSYARAVSVV